MSTQKPPKSLSWGIPRQWSHQFPDVNILSSVKSLPSAFLPVTFLSHLNVLKGFIQVEEILFLFHFSFQWKLRQAPLWILMTSLMNCSLEVLPGMGQFKAQITALKAMSWRKETPPRVLPQTRLIGAALKGKCGSEVSPTCICSQGREFLLQSL